MKTLNIMSWSLSDIFNYVNTPKNVNVLKHWTHLQQTRRPDVFKSDLVELALFQQNEEIQLSVIIDATRFIGLHKLLDFNIFSLSYKKCLFALFTKFCDSKLKRYAIDTTNLITNSIQNNLIEILDENEIKSLIKYTELRCQHIQAINHLLNPVYRQDYYNAQHEAENAYNVVTTSFEYKLLYNSDDDLSSLLRKDDFLLYEQNEFYKNIDNILEIQNEC